MDELKIFWIFVLTVVILAVLAVWWKWLRTEKARIPEIVIPEK